MLGKVFDYKIAFATWYLIRCTNSINPVAKAARKGHIQGIMGAGFSVSLFLKCFRNENNPRTTQTARPVRVSPRSVIVWGGSRYYEILCIDAGH